MYVLKVTYLVLLFKLTPPPTTTKAHHPASSYPTASTQSLP